MLKRPSCFMQNNIERNFQRIKTANLFFQLIVEADFIVNIYEDNLSHSITEKTLKKILKTSIGKIIHCKKYF